MDYQPNNKEIIFEIARGLGFNSNNLRRVAEFLPTSLGAAAALVAMPYAVPSSVRMARNLAAETGSGQPLDAGQAGVFAGIAVGLSADIGQLIGYFYLARNDHPEALLLPLATNAASGVYELGRHLYISARDRLIEKHRESLDEVLS